MTRLESDRIDAGIAASTLNDGSAAQGAATGGTPIPAGLPGKAAQHLFARLREYLGKEYASLRKGQDLTLEELLASLGAATHGDRLLRKQSASLKFLIASDIEHARNFPVAGTSGIARPMQAWRQRYRGLGRFLPRPS